MYEDNIASNYILDMKRISGEEYFGALLSSYCVRKITS